MPRDVHLLVLIHGLWGTPAHLEACRQEAVKAHEGAAGSDAREELRVLVANGSEGTLTYDGVEIFASRVGYQIDTLIDEVEKEGRKVTLFSVLGYSLGGLVARYLLGLLHSRDPSFFTLHRPYSFATIATPHLGIPKYTGSVLSGVFHSLGSRLISRTGEQLYVVDKEEGDGRALLEVMADPDEIFLQALNEYERIDIFANGCRDRTVPYPTASFSSFDPFTPLVPTHDIDDELLIEVDADRLIKRYSRKAGAFDDVLTGGEKELRVGGGGWGGWLRGKGRSGRSKGKKKTDEKLKKTHPPKLPPFLQFRWPFNYVLYVVLPLLFPVLLVLILTRFLLDSSRSRKRMTALRKLKTQHPSLIPGSASADAGTGNGTSTPTPFQPNGLSVDHLRQLIRRAERRIEGGLVDAAENGGIGEEEDEIDSRLDAGQAGASSPPSGLQSRARSGANTPSRFDPAAPDPTVDPALLPPPTLPPPKVQLALSPAQQRMVAGLNGGLDKHKLRKWIAWFPEAQNSHSVIIVRDPKQFVTHEEGRGVLRKWASLTVPPSEDQASG